MKSLLPGSIAAVAALLVFLPGSGARAADITRVMGRPSAPFATAVEVPPGFTTYYISGMTPGVADPSAPRGSVTRFGDTSTQVASALDRLKQTLAKLGLTFGDVVQAHVFLAGDPAKGGRLDYSGLNKAWSKEFGSPTQPNRPARVAVQVAALAEPGVLVEIELVAAKKAH